MFSRAQVHTRLRTHNNLLVVVGTAFLAGLEGSMIGVVWQPFVLSLGVSMTVLGFLLSLGGFTGLMPTLVSPVAGWFADRRGRKGPLLAGALCSCLAFALYTVAGVAGVTALLLPGVILLGLAALERPASSALVGESVSAGSRGSAYSLWMFAGVVPGIFAPLVAGWLADRTGYVIIFPIAFVIQLLAFGLIALYLREPPAPARGVVSWRELAELLRRAWVPPQDLRWFFIAIALDNFSWGMGWGLLFGLLTAQYALRASDLGVLSSVMSLSWAALQLPIGRYVDRLGSKVMLLISEALGPPLLLIWMTQSRFEILAASMALFALTAAMWVPARGTFISHAVDSSQRGEAFGRLTAFTGLIGFPSPFIGGFLFDHYGFAAPLLGNLVGSFIAVLLILFVVKEPTPARMAVSIQS